MKKKVWLAAGLMIAASAGACGEDGNRRQRSTPSAFELYSEPLEADAGAAEPAHVAPLIGKDEAFGTDLGDGNYHVDVRRPDGFTVFSSDFERAQGEYHVGYTLFSAERKGAPSAITSNQIAFTLDAANTGLQEAVDTALFIYLSMKTTAGGDYAADSAADYHGCDLMFAGMHYSCSNRGHCCEEHDQCFKKHGCAGVTWVSPALAKLTGQAAADVVTSWISQALQQGKLTPEKIAECSRECNEPVAQCFMRKTQHEAGMAPCCKADGNYCGQPRVEGATPRANQSGDWLFGALPGLQLPPPKDGGNPLFGKRRDVQTGASAGASGGKLSCSPEDEACNFVERCNAGVGAGCTQATCNPETGAGCEQDAMQCDPEAGEDCEGTDAQDDVGDEEGPDGVDSEQEGLDDDVLTEDSGDDDEGTDAAEGEDDTDADGDDLIDGEYGGDSTDDEPAGEDDTPGQSADEDYGGDSTSDGSGGDDDIGGEYSGEDGSDGTDYDDASDDIDYGADDASDDVDYGGDDVSDDIDYGSDDASDDNGGEYESI